MTTSTSNSLYITYVEKHGAFLRIWGQIDKNLSMVIENSLLELTPQFDQGHYVPAANNTPVGLFCCAKYKDGKYYRARVSNILMLPQNLVEVHFIDYGNKEILPITNLRTAAHLVPVLTSLPPQAHDFILANVTHIGLAWDNNTISLISNEIRYIELQFIVIQQVNSYTLIKLFRNGQDFALTLFNRGLVLSMASVSQTMILQSSNISANNIHTPIAPAPRSVVTAAPTLLSYKAVTIDPGSENNVYVSYVSDGPCQFSVQLQKLEESLARLMRELNRMPLHPLEEDPLPGTVCVAKCLEDDHICRAVVTSMVDGQYKVFYVDFGNTEIVPLTNLYQIPFKYVILKVMAMRYALAGLERSSVTLEMKCAFKEFVSDKLLRMRSLPPPTRSALPLCDLWDSNNVNVLDVLKKAAMVAYPDVLQLTRGFSQEVFVSYVYSCSHFYVQLKSKEEDLRTVMAELQVQCPQGEKLQLSHIKPGLPCCALFDADAQWYRAQILAQEASIIKVRYVDYGNEELVDVDNLRMPVGNLLTALRPQALECCLNGYQNMGDDVERDNILEELILEKEFTMRVIEMQNSRALVDLIDNARYNVGSLLLERLASARSQVSPLLIQESHQIEQRKRQSPKSSQDSHNQFERMNSRDSDKGWVRQDSSDRGFSPKESTNRGFNSRENRSFPRKDANDRFNQGAKDKGFSRDSNKAPVNGEWDRSNSNERKWNYNKQEETSNNERNNNRKQESWRQDKSPRDEFKKDNWSNNSDRPAYKSKRDDFNKGGDFSSNDQGFDKGWGKGKRDGFKKESWGNDSQSQSWRQKSPNVKESSEKSWSDGSEKSWRQKKGGDEKPFKRNDFKDRGNNRELFSKPRNNFEKPSTVKKVEDPAELTDVFAYLDLQGQTEDVLISWFHNPSSFFCQLRKDQDEFRNLMDDIQNTYCNIKPESAPVNAPVIALFPDDNVLYRAYVNEVKGSQYYIQFVDFGNFTTTSKVWRIEKKFMNLPAQAICCALDGIGPVDESDTWTNIDSFATYFDKETFTCTFNVGENNGYLVDLSYDNQSLSATLVSAGLAKSISIEDFDSSILLGQQLRVMLGEIQSLDGFYVCLQNGVQLLSTLHNLESAKETFDDTLKQYTEQVVIMYVDNVLEYKLEVTLYDTTGAIIKTIEPNEGAFESVDPLCQLPVLKSTINGWVSYLTPSEEEKFKLFIQPTEHASTIVQLLDSLFNQYDSSILENPLDVEVGLHYAVHSTDTNWYRGLVVSVEGENVEVCYIDYGNSETIAKTELRELTPELKETHALALEVLTCNIDESYSDQQVTINVWYGDNGWEATVTKLEGLSSDNVEVPPIAEPVQVTHEVEPSQLTESENVVASEDIVESSIGFAVTLSHVDNPSQFYLQLKEALGEIDTLQATLQEQIDSYPDLENPAAGVLCAAPYSLDQQWYRAQVLDADNDITTVRFVDYGNTDVITNATTRVKTLLADMLALEQHARRCSLLVQPKDGEEWSSAAHERFEALTNLDNLSIEIIHQDEKTTYVDLYADGQNIADVLLKEDLATNLHLEVESSCSGYVSNLNSPSEFWVQLENSVTDLEWIADQLLSAKGFPELEDLTPGSLCAALYPEDEMWYRARILSNTVAGLEVLFIDYGNSCTCTGLRQLPEDLIMLPALALKCCLQKPPGVLQWSSKATEKFKDISADGATIFNIDKLSTGETLIVKLLLDSEDISTQLLPETEKGFISYIDSISNFWIQKCEDDPKLEKISEEFLNASEWPCCEEVAVGSIVAALQIEDESWYRAKVLSINDSEYEVLFVDYGNVAVTNEIRSYKDDGIPPLVNNYKLEPLPGFRWIDTDATKQLKEISEEGSTVFDVEFENEDTVRLYLNDMDIRSTMDGVSVSSVQSTPKRGRPSIQSSLQPTSNDSEVNLENTNDFLELIEYSDGTDLNVDQNIEKLDDQIAAIVETDEDAKTLKNESEIDQVPTSEITEHIKSLENSTEIEAEITTTTNVTENTAANDSIETNDLKSTDNSESSDLSGANLEPKVIDKDDSVEANDLKSTDNPESTDLSGSNLEPKVVDKDDSAEGNDLKGIDNSESTDLSGSNLEPKVIDKDDSVEGNDLKGTDNSESTDLSGSNLEPKVIDKDDSAEGNDLIGTDNSESTDLSGSNLEPMVIDKNDSLEANDLKGIDNSESTDLTGSNHEEKVFGTVDSVETDNPASTDLSYLIHEQKVLDTHLDADQNIEKPDSDIIASAKLAEEMAQHKNLTSSVVQEIINELDEALTNKLDLLDYSETISDATTTATNNEQTKTLENLTEIKAEVSATPTNVENATTDNSVEVKHIKGTENYASADDCKVIDTILDDQNIEQSGSNITSIPELDKETFDQPEKIEQLDMAPTVDANEKTKTLENASEIKAEISTASSNVIEKATTVDSVEGNE